MTAVVHTTSVSLQSAITLPGYHLFSLSQKSRILGFKETLDSIELSLLVQYRWDVFNYSKINAMPL